MFVALFIVFLLCHQGNADPFGLRYRCNDSSSNSGEQNVTFKPSVDGVPGRYTAELCTSNKLDRTELTMDLTYNPNLNICDAEYRKSRKRGGALKPGPQHSSNRVNVSGLTDCPHVCYSMDFDLIFRSCYLLKISSNGHGDYPIDSYHLVQNNLTLDHYNKISAHINFFKYNDYFKLEWFLGIPAVEYTVSLHKINNKTGDYDTAVDVTQNCSLQADVRQVHCTLAPPYGCYHAELQHGGLWIFAVFNQKRMSVFDLCYWAVPAPRVVRGARVVWWALGGGALALAALAASAALLRRLRLRDYHKRAIVSWLSSARAEAPPPAAPRDTCDSRDVLLLYAREGELGQQAAAALRDLVQHTTGGTVYDIFSPAVMSACAAAPHTWLRALLARSDTRVLLLQSPALHALYQDQLHDDEHGLRLREPLLGRRALYRVPHFGDQLLTMALRQLAESADAHHAYCKYYLATYAGLETDVLPTLVPYRRYVLPDAARVLARDLGAQEPCAARLAEAARAAHALVTHAQQHPDYLMDEIYVN